jgi:hypothetical protein
MAQVNVNVTVSGLLLQHQTVNQTLGGSTLEDADVIRFADTHNDPRTTPANDFGWCVQMGILCRYQNGNWYTVLSEDGGYSYFGICSDKYS